MLWLVSQAQSLDLILFLDGAPALLMLGQDPDLDPDLDQGIDSTSFSW